ncbi:EAL domain-containing response regulator [Colwellia piezophila]|uniref:EAL domain-containing response regulator n=1 Tax=Colwellia piezophila TaxID=211668 RepID=UPI000365ADF9|nr:EAL domain-containing protein [Colwellia piezophila]
MLNNILIVEDDLFQQKLIAKMLSTLTLAKITTASNGQEALSKLDKIDEPELILCDLNMPGMDGIEFLRIIAKRNLDANVVLTSSVSKDVISSVKEMVLACGMPDILSLTKPISKKQLELVLLQLIEKKQVRKPTENSQSQLVDDEIITGFNLEQFNVLFQPHIDVETDTVSGAEALVRWNHPTRGVLTPYFFLEQIYKLGLSHLLTLQVLDYSIAACSRWHQQGMNFNISVNISPLDLVESDFLESVMDILAQHQLPAKFLTLEITESAISPNMAKELEVMCRLRLHGINLSIDDFGTGFSSLSQLISSPFTELKVDMSFVQKMLTDSKNYAAVKASLQLARDLKLKTVVEGVETQAEANAIKALGCDVFQGWLYAPALVESEFLSWSQNHNKKSIDEIAKRCS